MSSEGERGTHRIHTCGRAAGLQSTHQHARQHPSRLASQTPNPDALLLPYRPLAFPLQATAAREAHLDKRHGEEANEPDPESTASYPLARSAALDARLVNCEDPNEVGDDDGPQQRDGAVAEESQLCSTALCLLRPGVQATCRRVARLVGRALRTDQSRKKRPREKGRAMVHPNTARVCSRRCRGTKSGANLPQRERAGQHAGGMESWRGEGEATHLILLRVDLVYSSSRSLVEAPMVR